MYSASKCFIQLENGGLSKSLNFKVVQEGEIAVKDKTKQKAFFLGMSVALGKNKVFSSQGNDTYLNLKFRRTKMITVGPRFLLVNKMGQTLYYQQVGNDKRFTLGSGEILPFHWPNNKAAKNLSISLDLGGIWRW